MTPGGAGALRRTFERHGFRPSKYRGQCFLVDGNLAGAIVRDAALDADENVLEIGCGAGALTARLAGSARRVLAVEIEPALAEACAEAVGRGSGVEIVRADALAGKRRLAREVEERLPGLRPYVLVANLPYAVAGPILVELGRARAAPERMVVTVQEEVALRITAHPGDPEYGPLTAALAIGWSAEIVRRVPREVFWPRPRVGSAVVRLLPREGRPAPEAYRVELAGIHRLFRWPRKTLRAVLREAGASAPEKLLRHLDPRARVGDLGLEDLRALARALAAEDPAEGESAEGSGLRRSP